MRFAEVECLDCKLHFKVVCDNGYPLKAHCLFCGSPNVKFNKIDELKFKEEKK